MIYASSKPLKATPNTLKDAMETLAAIKLLAAAGDQETQKLPAKGGSQKLSLQQAAAFIARARSKGLLKNEDGKP